LFGPKTFTSEGDEAVYAEHQLISGKPRLQATGDTLQDITMDVYMRAEFCNPDEQLKAIKKAKDDKTILPLLWGNGKYVNDYVIISFPYTIEQALPDGTPLQVSLTLTIKEYISYNKLEQKQLQDRKNAFAVGDKNPVTTRKPQPEDINKTTSRSITEAQQQVNKTDGLVSDYENNISKRGELAKKITDTTAKINDKINQLNDNLENVREDVNTVTAIKAAAASVVTAAQGIKSLFPVTNVKDLMDANTYLQSTSNTLGSVSAPLIQGVIIRKP
jgi:phage protein U